MESKTWRRAVTLHSRVLAVGLLFSLQSCSSKQHVIDGLPAECVAGQICTLDGMLVGSKWDARLELADSCVALAVPESFSDVARLFDGRFARVIGEAYTQPAVTPGRESYYYVISEMRVNTNECESTAILVDSITLKGGRSWKK